MPTAVVNRRTTFYRVLLFIYRAGDYYRTERLEGTRISLFPFTSDERSEKSATHKTFGSPNRFSVTTSPV